MNLWSRIACTLLLAAGFSAGQTAPANSPSPAPGSPAKAPPAPSSGAPSLELTSPEIPGALGPQTPRPSGSAAPGSGAKPATGAQGKAAAASADSSRYVLGPNDVVSITVWGDKNLTNFYTIGPDGQMSMSLIGDFKATGLTIPGLQDLITEKLGGYINDPIVNVQLSRNNSKWYTLVGGVAKAGPVQLLRETTILDALAAAGGFKDFANKKKIYLMRGTTRFPFNYNQVIKFENVKQNITIEDGDIIVIPE